MPSLGEEYPQQQARCRDLLLEYQKIGPAGAFGATMIKETLREADEAAVSSDVVAMLRAFEKMKAHE